MPLVIKKEDNMKKLKVNVTQNIHVRDELKIEKVQGIDHILWKGRHYYADVIWYKVLNEDEKLSPQLIETNEWEYGDESKSVEPDDVEEDILVDSDDEDYFFESGCTFEIE